MQSIVSGTSTERVVRTLLLMLLIDGFTVAYLWDGYVGYAKQNSEEFIRLLGLPIDAAPSTNASLTEGLAQRIALEVPPGSELSTVASIVGEPSLEHGGDAYYLGPGGWLKVQMTGSRVASIAWTNGPKSESDQQWQRWIGYGLAFGGLLAAVRFAMVIATRMTLSDEGLKVGNRSLIPFESMTVLRADPKGGTACVELEYSLDGKLHRARLDRYVFKRLPEIVASICEQKGFANPWPSATTEVRGA